MSMRVLWVIGISLVVGGNAVVPVAQTLERPAFEVTFAASVSEPVPISLWLVAGVLLVLAGLGAMLVAAVRVRSRG
jgi:hypothetical protein